MNGYEHQTERRAVMNTLMTMRPPRVNTAQIGSKEIDLQRELKNRFDTLQ